MWNFSQTTAMPITFKQYLEENHKEIFAPHLTDKFYVLKSYKATIYICKGACKHQ